MTYPKESTDAARVANLLYLTGGPGQKAFSAAGGHPGNASTAARRIVNRYNKKARFDLAETAGVATVEEAIAWWEAHRAELGL